MVIVSAFLVYLLMCYFAKISITIRAIRSNNLYKSGVETDILQT